MTSAQPPIVLGVAAENAREVLREAELRLAAPRQMQLSRHFVGRLGLLTTPGACQIANTRELISVVVSARFDDRSGVLDALGLASDATDADVVLAGFLRWGEALPLHLAGDFAFVVGEPRPGRFSCVVDRMGIGILFTIAMGGEVAGFASHVTPLRRAFGGALEFDQHTLARYLCRLPADPACTSFVGIERVAPGTRVVLSSGRRSVHEYWSLRDLRRRHFASPADSLEAYGHGLRRAIQRRLAPGGVVAVAHSGGLDSSAILCLSHRIQAGATIQPITVQPAQQSCNEAEQVRLLGDWTGLRTHVLRPDAGLGVLRWVGQAVGEPRYLDYAPIAWSILSGAHEVGAQRMLTGLYGDLVTGSVPRSAWRASLLREAASGNYRALSSFVAELAHAGPTAAVGAFVSSASRAVPLVERRLRNTRSRRRRAQWLSFACLQPAVVGELGLGAEGDAFLAEQERAHSDVEFCRFAWLDRARPAETELLGRVGQWVGMQAAHPFADLDLLEISLSLPVESLWKGGLSRHLHREALVGVVPEPLRLQKRKVIFNDLYREMFEAHIPELLGRPLVPALEGLLSRRRLETLAQSGAKSFVETAHLWRCLAVNAWIWEHGRKE